MTTQTYQSLIPLFDELRGERVVVRPYRMEDAEVLFAAIDDSREHLRTFLPFERYQQSVDDTRDWIAHKEAAWRLRDDLTMGIWEAASGRFLGGTGYHLREPGRWKLGYLEIGYWLRKSAEGHGYMTETVRLLTDYAFESLAANRVEIICDARNIRSAAVPKRLGFMLEGWLRNHQLGPGEPPRDTLIFALTRDDPRWSTAN